MTLRRSRRVAAALVGDKRKGYTTLAARYDNIAYNLAVALDCARRDDSDGTCIYLWCAELCRQRVPADLQARWAMVEPFITGPAPEPKPIGHPFNPNS